MKQSTLPLPRNDESFDAEFVAAMSGRSLHLILLPTEQCNFRCTYCYEDFSIGRMRPETIQGIKNLLVRRMVELEQLNISWFGGEPLTARTIVEDISSFIIDAVAGAPQIQYAADVTTNGYHLDLSTAETWEQLGIRSYQISLDGPEALHDTTRRRANGRGSFRRIWNNLLAVRQSRLPVRILLRIHLTPDNLPSMQDFLPQVRETFLTDDRFSVHLKPIERMGGPNNDDIPVLGYDGRDRMRNLESLLREGLPYPKERERKEACYAARPNSLVVRANGNIAKCTVALSDPSNSIGRITPQGELQIDNGRLAPWVRGWASSDWAAVTCPYVGLPQSTAPLLQIGTRPTVP